MDEFVSSPIKKFAKKVHQLSSSRVDSNFKSVLRKTILFRFNNKCDFKEASISMSELINRAKEQWTDRTIIDINRSVEALEDTTIGEDNNECPRGGSFGTLTLSLTNLNRSFDEQNRSDDEESRHTIQLNRTDSNLVVNNLKNDRQRWQVVKLKITTPRRQRERGKPTEQETQTQKTENLAPPAIRTAENGRKFPVRPIMGVAALSMREHKSKTPDQIAEIVHRLVIANFNEFLDNYERKRNDRETLRRKRFGNCSDGSDLDTNLDEEEVLPSDPPKTDEESSDNDRLSSCGTAKNYEFDSQQFLKNALGDEYFSLNKSYSTNHSFNTLEASDLVSNGSSCSSGLKFSSTPIERRQSVEKKVWGNKQEALEYWRKRRDTLERKRESLDSKRESLESKRESLESKRESLESKREYLEGRRKTGDFFTEGLGEKLRLLYEESSRQYQVMLQTTKALNFCRLFNLYTREKAEAERILLVATKKRALLSAEISKRSFFDANDSFTEKASSNYGVISLSTVKFQAKTNLRHSSADDHLRQWFVCLFIYNETKVLATKLATLSEDTNELNFGDRLRFDRLRSDFTIKLELYSLKLKKHKKDDLQTLRKSPLKHRIFGKPKLLDKSGPEQRVVSTPAFKLWSERTIDINDLSSFENGTLSLSMTSSALSSNLADFVRLEVACDVVLNDEHGGFVTVGVETSGRVAWTRRWCLLTNGLLKFYNDPERSDEEAVGYIDLRLSRTWNVELARRELCARARTLLLETVDDGEKGGTMCGRLLDRFYLAIDTLEELRLWKDKINSTLFYLMSWKHATKRGSL